MFQNLLVFRTYAINRYRKRMQILNVNHSYQNMKIFCFYRTVEHYCNYFLMPKRVKSAIVMLRINCFLNFMRVLLINVLALLQCLQFDILQMRMYIEKKKI
ncbi:hypothetical protein T4D_11785 [Trichinella pseudospiralis]|uniref:Uncharacterized protein n=1 Tax=Trichinella pseudospiralis TaxID=6337 RepID=A0A0V1G632_TRIPS|nr:hypothetical protein T4D_11785 [Trichinella pseudospiralis]